MFSYKRLPDIICIGSKKCGTSAFQYYLGLHPDIKANNGEPHFFDTLVLKDKKGTQENINHYLKKLPFAHKSSDLIFEKTPKLVVVEGVPEKINQTVGNQETNFHLDDMVFVHIYCDPIKRLVSDFVHSVKGPVTKKRMKCHSVIKERYNGDLNIYLKKMLPKIFACQFGNPNLGLYKNRNINCPDPKFNFNQTIQRVDFPDTQPMPGCSWSIITNGLYSILIKKWLNHPKIGLDKMIFINGDELIRDLPRIIIKFEDILIERNLLSKKYFKMERFEKDHSTGFWCYRPENGVRKCLADNHPNKGRTRGQSKNIKYTLSTENRLDLEKLFRPYQNEFEKIIDSNKI